jgi:hypothetical protein
VGLMVGRAGLEPATNGLSVPIWRAHDQAKWFAPMHQVAWKATNLPVANTVPVRLRYG